MLNVIEGGRNASRAFFFPVGTDQTDTHALAVAHEAPVGQRDQPFERGRGPSGGVGPARRGRGPG